MRTLPVRPFAVGSVTVDPPLVLAPMEDVTNQPFRLIAKRIGNPGLMVTEFVSAMAARYAPARARHKMLVAAEERPLAIQIFGADPEALAEVARMAGEMGADVIDINMGCWVSKVVKQGAGAALLKDPALAEQIVRVVARAVKVPVSVKVRAGWDYALFAAPELGKRFEQAGAKMITLHARFARQGFEGQADWSLIRDMKAAVGVPVVGNGDVKTSEDALRMLAQTGCDGVMVGRAAIANPWVLADIAAAFRGEEPVAGPTMADRVSVAMEHLRSLIDLETERDGDKRLAELRAVRHLRGQIPLYVKAVRGAAQARDRLTRCTTAAEVEDVLASVAAASANLS